MSWLSFVGRPIVGVLLAVALSVIGIGAAWATFVFWGGRSHATLLTLFVVGAGLGAGLGSLLAWTRIDGVPSWPVLLTAAAVVVLVGTAGAWAGFQFGATREVECCVGPAIEPITYMAGGATLLANVAALVLAAAYDVKIRRAAGKLRRPVPGSAVGAPGATRRLPD